MDASEWTTLEGEDALSLGLIGAGGYGEIHEIYDRQRSQCIARKLIRPFAGSVSEEEVVNELRAVDKLCRSSHPNIIEIFRHGRLRHNSVFYYIDMELCDCNLEEYRQGRKSIPRVLSWAKAVECGEGPFFLCSIMRQVISGLKFIHAHDEVHRDLNPQNVLYSSRSDLWKIADFGLTSHATTTRARTTYGGRGKQSYRAPELLRDPKLTFNKKVDIWSLGCILFELITGQKAFESDFHVFEFLASSSKRELPNSSNWLDEILKTSFTSLIDTTLQSDYRKRPSADSLLNVIDDLIISHFPAKVEHHAHQIVSPSLFPLSHASVLTEIVTLGTASHSILTDAQLPRHDDMKALTVAVENTAITVASSDMGGTPTLHTHVDHISTNPVERMLGADDIGRSDKGTAQPIESIVDHPETLQLPPRLIVDDINDHPDISSGQNGVVIAHDNMARRQRAAELLEDTPERRKKALGIDHPDTLLTQHGFAATYRDLGRHQKAAELYETLQRRTKALGPDHPDTLIAEYNTAVAYYDLKQYQKAAEVFEDTLQRQKKALGIDHPDTLLTQHGLAATYRDLGRHQKAAEVFEDTLQRQKKALGPDHPDTLRTQHGLAVAYSHLGRHQKAAELYEDTPQRRTKALGPDHPDTLTTLHLHTAI